MDEALRSRIETGPADAVEEEVASAHGGDVAIGGQTFDPGNGLKPGDPIPKTQSPAASEIDPQPPFL